MKRQFYFTVFYDEAQGSWTVDNDTCVAVFSDGTVWDDEDKDWRPPTEGEEEALDAYLAGKLEALLHG